MRFLASHRWDAEAYAERETVPRVGQPRAGQTSARVHEACGDKREARARAGSVLSSRSSLARVYSCKRKESFSAFKS